MSYLTESPESLRRQVIAGLESEGFAYDPLRSTFSKYLATCLGRPNAYKTETITQMLDELNSTFGGEDVSFLRLSYAHLLDILNGTLSGADSGGGVPNNALVLDGKLIQLNSKTLILGTA